MAKNISSAEYNHDENYDFEGYNNRNIRDNESILPDSDPDL